MSTNKQSNLDQWKQILGQPDLEKLRFKYCPKGCKLEFKDSEGLAWKYLTVYHYDAVHDDSTQSKQARERSRNDYKQKLKLQHKQWFAVKDYRGYDCPMCLGWHDINWSSLMQHLNRSHQADKASEAQTEGLKAQMRLAKGRGSASLQQVPVAPPAGPSASSPQQSAYTSYSGQGTPEGSTVPASVKPVPAQYQCRKGSRSDTGVIYGFVAQNEPNTFILYYEQGMETLVGQWAQIYRVGPTITRIFWYPTS